MSISTRFQTELLGVLEDQQAAGIEHGDRQFPADVVGAQGLRR